jgi:hypothetical protein
MGHLYEPTWDKYMDGDEIVASPRKQELLEEKEDVRVRTSRHGAQKFDGTLKYHEFEEIMYSFGRR